MFKLIQLSQNKYEVQTARKTVQCSKNDMLNLLSQFGVDLGELHHCLKEMDHTGMNVANFGVSGTVTNFERTGLVH